MSLKPFSGPSSRWLRHRKGVDPYVADKPALCSQHRSVMRPTYIYTSYIHINTHTHTYINTYIHAHKHIHTPIHIHIHAYIYTHIHTNTFTHTQARTTVHQRRFTPPFGDRLATLDKHIQVNIQTKLAHITRSIKENGYWKRHIQETFRPVEEPVRQHSSRNSSARPIHHLGGTIWEVYISQKPW
jgi:hypothetical protein